jgi:hypothetical protein
MDLEDTPGGGTEIRSVGGDRTFFLGFDEIYLLASVVASYSLSAQ